MALSKVNPNLITQGPSGRKNLIINGAMQVAQRGIESTNTNGGYKTMDRWNMFDNLGKINHYQSTEGPAGFNNSYKWVVHTTATAGTSSIVAPNQSIEGFNSAHLEWGTSDAKSVTVSFWCKTSVTGSYGLWIRNGAANRYYNTMCTISNANTWTYITKTIPGDTSGTWIGATNGNGLTVGICLDAGSGVQGTADQWSGNTTYSTTANAAWQASSGATFFLTGFQLELGSVATDFEHRSFGEELSLCGRYYEVTQGGTTEYAETTGNYLVSVPFRVKKRASPTLAVIAADENCASNVQVTDAGTNMDNKLGARVYANNRFLSGLKYWYARFSADAEL